MNKIEFKSINKLLRREIAPAIGCTEPIAVAYAVARACELIECEPDNIDVVLSANILKNAMGVGIPGTGMIGLPIAIALGVKIGRSEYGLEVLRNVNEQAVEHAKKYMSEHEINIRVKDDIEEKLYIEINAYNGQESSVVIVAKLHTNIIKECKNGHVIFDKGLSAAQDVTGGDVELSMRKIYDYALQSDLEDISWIMEAGRLNHSAAKSSFENDYGHNVGKIFSKPIGVNIFGESPFSRILAYTAAACDARMAGAMIPVMSNSGSGNQGITTTLPVYMYAKTHNIKDEQLIRALIISSLTAIYVKQHLGRLSALCGCVVAAMGSSCGITYLMNGTYEHLCFAVKNMVANLTGMVCDGAKPSCALKLSSGVSMALLSAVLAVEGQTVTSLEGIIDEDVDQCIDNLSRIGRDSMNETDRLIVNIMTSKTC